jgi:rhomboid protease GluP
MDEFLKKIRLIYWPFLYLSVGFIAIYTLLNWLIIIKLELFRIDEMYTEYWIPVILVWIPILFILRKRIKLLKLTGDNGNLPFLYNFLVAFAFVIPTVIAQGYIKTSTGKLSKLESSKFIDNKSTTKYYQFDKIYLDKRFANKYWYVEVSGKHNEYLNFYCYIALPVMSEPQDTNSRFFSTWYGLEYSDQFSNRLDDSEKEKEYQRFQKRTLAQFNNENIYNFIYFDKLGINERHERLVKSAMLSNCYDHSTDILILKPVNEPFEQRNGSAFGWIFGSYGIAAFFWFLMIFFPSFNTTELNKFQKGIKPKSKIHVTHKTILSFIIPQKGFFSTHLIIELNLVIFLCMVFSGLGFLTFNGSDLLAWGANFRPNVTDGECWRLLTSTFLHGGVMHLLMNLYGLFFIGLFLEPLLNSKRFGLFYLISGIMASVFSIMWHEATVSVGASGAIFGMYGIFLSLLLTKIYPKDFQKSFLASTLIFVGYNLLIGLTGGIDNAAHIGGLITGMIIGFAIYPTLRKEKAMKEKK